MNPNPAPSDPKRLMLAVALSAGVMLVWTWLFPPQKPQTPPTETTSAAPSSPGVASGGLAAGGPASAPGSAALDALAGHVETTQVLAAPSGHEIVVSSRDGQIQAWDLTEAQYRKAGGPDARALRVVQPASAALQKGVFLPPRVEVALEGRTSALPYTFTAGPSELVARATDPATGVAVERVFRPGTEPYTFEVSVRLHNTSAQAVPYGLEALLRGAQNDKEAAGRFFAPPVYQFEAVCAFGDTLERQTLDTVADNRASADAEDRPYFATNVRWAGVDNRYFMTALVPGPEGISSCEYFVGAEAALVAPSEISPETRYVATRLVLPGGSLAPGEKVERSWRVYGGPKKLEALESYSPSLSAAVDFGWLSALSLPMLHTLEFFHGLVPNWGIAIILLTVLVKLLTLPLTHKQYKSMAGMKLLQPQLKELQEKYKDDRVRLQQEMMGLYKKNGVNPLSGCLPVLLMMPVYIALYKTIYSAVELYQADLAGWITDLSEPDPYFVLPLVLGVFFVIQTRLNPTSGDELQQKLMLWIMPVMFTGMMLFLPSGLVVYILANTLLGILQQLYMNRVTAAAPVAGAAAVGKG